MNKVYLTRFDSWVASEHCYKCIFWGSWSLKFKNFWVNNPDCDWYWRFHTTFRWMIESIKISWNPEEDE